KGLPPQSAMSMPRCSAYQARRLAASPARWKTPPIPVTRSMAAMLAGRAAPADAIELARAQERDEHAAGALHPHRGDARLLHVDAPAREVVDDLREVGLVAHHEDALLGGRGQQLQGAGGVEAARQRLVLDRLDAELLAGEQRRVARAHPRAREGEVE